MSLTDLRNRLEVLKKHYNKTLDKSVVGEMKRLTRLFSTLDSITDIPRR